MYSGGEIDFISIVSAFLMSDRVGSDQFAKVVHDKAGKDFLVDILHFFRMKVEQTDGVFQVTKRGFNAPAHIIEIFYFDRRESTRIEIRDHGLKTFVCELEAKDANI